MKKYFVGLLLALVLLVVSTAAVRADEFSQIENSPYTYWVPPPDYGSAPPPGPYAYGPPPPGYYYGPPPPPRPVIILPPFFLRFHFH